LICEPKVRAHPTLRQGIYIFTWKTLRKYLVDDEANPDSENDFGKNIIPTMLRDKVKLVAYRFEGYWKDVGTLDSLWDANMDMLSPGSGLNLLDKNWPIYGRSPSCPPSFIGLEAEVANSAIAKGCDIRGEVKNSVLSCGTAVEEGAEVAYSVVMPGVTIEKGAHVSYAIIGENCRIGRNAVIGCAPEDAGDPLEWGITVLGPGTEVEEGRIVPAKTLLDRSSGKAVK